MPRGKREVDDLLLSALACGATNEVAAQRAGVSVATVERRKRDPKFKKRLNHARAEMVQRTTSTLTAASTEAVRALLDLVKPSAREATRLGAARAILELGTRQRESEDLEQRVLDLEQRLDEKSSSK